MITVLVTAILIAVFLKAFIVDSRAIPTTSMVPTIEPGDRVVLSRVSYWGSRAPERGDVVVFSPPEELNENSDLIKRVIGLPGETVEVKNGLVYIDGVALDEPYVNEAPDYAYGPVTVPDDCYLVMGDNRNVSVDSHLWINPFLNEDSIKGKAVCLYWPINRIGAL